MSLRAEAQQRSAEWRRRLTTTRVAGARLFAGGRVPAAPERGVLEIVTEDLKSYQMRNVKQMQNKETAFVNKPN